MTNMIKTVTFGRHGESEQNIVNNESFKITTDQADLFSKRDSGDHRLTDKGINDGRVMGEIIRKVDASFDLLVVSSFIRTMETLLATGLDGRVEISALLDERYLGELDLLLTPEIRESYPTTKGDRARSETRWRSPNGESMRDVLTRVLVFMEHLKAIGSSHPFIVAHSRVIGSYIWWAEQLEDSEVPSSAYMTNNPNVVVNGQVIQYGWSKESLHPTHKRSFVPGKELDLEWKPLAPDARFSMTQLRQLVDNHSRIF